MKADLHLRKGSFALLVRAAWPDGGMTAITGPSGAGKSSFLRAFCGLERASGTAELGGHTLQNDTAFTPAHRRRIAWVSQHDDVFAPWSVVANLAFAQRHAAPGGPDMTTLAGRFGLTPRLRQSAGALSGGQKQRLILARALVSNPQLLALDEPFSALDAEGRHEMLALLRQICSGRALPVLFVSHDFNTLNRLADFMLYMDGGHILAQGPLNSLLTDPRLPFVAREDACVVLRAKGIGYDAKNSLNRLDLGGASLLVPGPRVPTGQNVRLRLRAGDVSLSRETAAPGSILNTAPVRVQNILQGEAVGAPAAGLATVVLDMAGQTVLARISRKSALTLDVQAGMSLYASIKASALGVIAGAD